MKKLSLLTLVLLTLFACRKNIEQDLTTTTTNTPPTITTIDYEPEVIEVIATLFGEVYDEAGTPVANANVTLDDNNTSTDDKGRFVFKDVTMNKLGTYVEVNKNGFFPGSNRFFPEAGSVNYVKITLLSQSNVGNFPAADGALINTSEGISIDFPANSIVDSDGNLYQGTVVVAARWIDPTSDNLQEIMPGGLQGIMRGGAQGGSMDDDFEEVALASFSMMAVELESNNGEPLNLGNNKNATLSFPVPPELLGNAPSEIPLWYFEETIGLWVTDGSATLEGDKYVGSVSHFSFWNCDAPFNLTKVCGTILSSTGSPLVNSPIKITILSSGESACGWTNNDGEFSGKVAADELLEMTVYENWYCSDPLLTETLGPIPYNPDTTFCEDLGTFTTANPSEEINISATILDCSGSPVTNGWLEINLGGNIYSFYVDDGNNVDIALTNCNGLTVLTALAGNIDDLMESTLATYTITNPLDLGTISACGTTTDEWIIIEIEGDSTILTGAEISYDSSDSLYIGAWPSGGFENVFLSIEGVTGPTPITLDSIDLNHISFEVDAPSGGMYSNSCGNAVFSGCTYSTREITELGAIGSGDPVTGEFSGVLELWDSGIPGSVTKNVSITFNVPRL